MYWFLVRIDRCMKMSSDMTTGVWRGFESFIFLPRCSSLYNLRQIYFSFSIRISLRGLRGVLLNTPGNLPFRRKPTKNWDPLVEKMETQFDCRKLFYTYWRTPLSPRIIYFCICTTSFCNVKTMLTTTTTLYDSQCVLFIILCYGLVHFVA